MPVVDGEALVALERHRSAGQDFQQTILVAPRPGAVAEPVRDEAGARLDGSLGSAGREQRDLRIADGPEDHAASMEVEQQIASQIETAPRDDLVVDPARVVEAQREALGDAREDRRPPTPLRLLAVARRALARKAVGDPDERQELPQDVKVDRQRRVVGDQEQARAPMILDDEVGDADGHVVTLFRIPQHRRRVGEASIDRGVVGKRFDRPIDEGLEALERRGRLDQRGIAPLKTILELALRRTGAVAVPFQPWKADRLDARRAARLDEVHRVVLALVLDGCEDDDVVSAQLLIGKRLAEANDLEIDQQRRSHAVLAIGRKKITQHQCMTSTVQKNLP